MSYIPNVFLIVPVGLLMGLLLALPFGPVNLLGLQRAVQRGFFGGMAAGLGIMLGDGLIALFAALGVNAITGAIREYRVAIQVVGGLALLGAGLKLYVTPLVISTDQQVENAGLRDYAWDIPTDVLLTITIRARAGLVAFLEASAHSEGIPIGRAVMVAAIREAVSILVRRCRRHQPGPQRRDRCARKVNAWRAWS